MLNNAGVLFDARPANIDEEKILTQMQDDGADAKIIALTLSQEKAKKISNDNKEKIIIGSDQVLTLDKKLFSKVTTEQEAIDRLENFQGKKHQLVSAVSVYRDGQEIWHNVDEAHLKMRPLNRQDIEKYIKIAGNDVYDCVGCYAVEGVGIRLFETVKGDYFTIEPYISGIIGHK